MFTSVITYGNVNPGFHGKRRTMDNLVDDLVRTAQKCETAGRSFEKEPFASMHNRIVDAVGSLHSAWSGSWIGHHATIYTKGLRPARPGEIFDSEWGTTDSYSSSRTSGDWEYFDEKTIRDAIIDRAKPIDLGLISSTANAMERVFEESREELLATLDAILSTADDSTLGRIRDDMGKLKSRVSAADFIKAIRPTRIESRDSLAIQQGVTTPAHIAFQAWYAEQRSYASQATELAKIARRAARYLQSKDKMKGSAVAKTDGKIVIGHGRSPVWKQLKDFLVDRLKLDYEEFNREPVPGLSTKERLLQMLDASCFAFLVMTGEDEHADGKQHARANVIHEAGLFQGRYGFERAIILLEEGCEEFSNVEGIGQIRFPKGNISAEFEEIRRVLEREGIIRP